MIKNIKYNFFAFLVISATINLNACNNRREKQANSKYTEVKENPIINVPEKKIKKVTYFIENSGSVFGYVRNFSEYVSAISELSEKPEFVSENTIRSFNFINGNDLTINYLGNDPILLKNNLNVRGYNCGDILHSNLNEMFQKALDNCGDGLISILISDGIYDIGEEDAPFNALVTKGKETRSKFIKKLEKGDIQTILVKLNSSFNGDYCYASKRGRITINHKRPYYIWIFGESSLLNKYFTEEYISTKLAGYESMVRFFKLGQVHIPYQATSQNKLGNLKFGKRDKNILEDVEMDRNGRGFGFSVAVDFTSLPLSDTYFNNKANYECSGNFYVVEVQKVVINNLYEVSSFVPSHLIHVHSKLSPYGALSIGLKNTVPLWISTTNIDSETNIETNSSQTFGFKYLIEGISEAYQFVSPQKNIVTFSIAINK